MCLSCTALPALTCSDLNVVLLLHAGHDLSGMLVLDILLLPALTCLELTMVLLLQAANDLSKNKIINK
jgi:hypothetical protein